jgi:hypothetical protein
VRFLDGERPIDRADVVLSGPRFRIAALEREAFDLQITRFLALDWSERGSAELHRRRPAPRPGAVQGRRGRAAPAGHPHRGHGRRATPVTLSLDSVELRRGAVRRPLAPRHGRLRAGPPVVLGKAAEIDALGKRTDKPSAAC